MSKQTNEIDEMLNFEEQEARKRRILAVILDSLAGEKNRFIALKGEMGETLRESGRSHRVPSYTAVHDLDWIGQNVKMGSEMPFMETNIDPQTGRLIINETNAEKIKQRAPDWSRQPALSAYLAHDHNRKFSSILAVISPEWIDDPNSENWGKDGRALRSATDFESLDSTGTIGLLNLDSHYIYALDGQHRVMGIRGIQELQGGGLVIKKKDGSPAKGRITREEFLSKFNLVVTHLQKLLSERMTIEYIPAVVAGETREEASRRVRHVFASINQYAKRPDKGEQILLNESDGYSIVARNVGFAHPLFKKKHSGDRINWKNTSLPKRSSWYTTLTHLREMAEEYLSRIDSDRARRWEPFYNDQVPIRPDEAEMDEAEQQLAEFFDYVAQLPVFKGLAASGDDENIDEIREFEYSPGKGKPTVRGKAHLLLRPIGQTILARTVGRLVLGGYSLKDVFEKFSIYDGTGGFEMNKPESLWFKVTFDPIKMKMIMSYQDGLAVDLLVYMVKGATSDERTKLLKEIVAARTVKDGHWLNFSGEAEPINFSNIDLPQPIK